MLRLVIVLVLTSSLLLADVAAEHEPNHRYVIRGYVLGDGEQPVTGQVVNVLSAGDLLGSAKTDERGFYALHLHLHDADLSRLLTLKTGQQEAQIRVTFKAGDRRSIRVHEANFVAGRFIEKELGKFRVSPLVYVMAGLVAFGAVVFMLESRRKKNLRKAAAAHTPPPTKSKRRKSKRQRR